MSPFLLFPFYLKHIFCVNFNQPTNQKMVQSIWHLPELPDCKSALLSRFLPSSLSASPFLFSLIPSSPFPSLSILESTEKQRGNKGVLFVLFAWFLCPLAPAGSCSNSGCGAPGVCVCVHVWALHVCVFEGEGVKPLDGPPFRLHKWLGSNQKRSINSLPP